MNKLLKRLIALFLVIILMSMNLVILGEYTIAYALSDEELNEQDSRTNQSNVEFNSYFYGESHNATFDINSEEAKLYIRVNVKNAGYLENGTIEFQSANFKLKDGISNENIQSIDIENNRIVLNRINNGSDITIELPIEILEGESVAIDYFNKETTAKFTGTYVNGNGTERAVEKEVINKLSWKGTAEAELTAEATKYVPYATNGNYGVLVQTKVNSNVKDSTLPIKSTNIEVTVPTINGTKPTDVKVIATSMEATNGKANGLDFTGDNYSYDQEAGKITINTSNLADSISWKKDVKDEYLVTYLFEGQDIYEYANENGIDSSVTVNSNISLYNSEDISAESTATAEVKYTEKYKAITDFNVSTADQMSKGYIYANYDTDQKVETEYYSKYTATVNAAKLVEYLQFNQSNDVFLTEDDAEGSTTVGGNNYAYNKRVEISQAIFNKILGEDGAITIKDEEGTELGVINKDTELKDGVYSVDISDKNNNKLVIETTAPITEGQLELNVVKALKGNIDYSKEQMQSFTKMEMELVGKTNTTTFTSMTQTLLKEPETKVDLELSKTDLTTVVTNENVEIRAVLDTSSVYNALFKNPTLKITLPSEIETVNVKNSSILLDNGLKIKSTEVTEENGRKVINVVLEGTQTEYAIDAEYKGAIIILNTDLTLSTLTPSGTSNIRLDYTNENEVATKAEGQVEKEINFVAPNGVVAASGISNYREGASDVLSISDEAQTVDIDTYSDERVATMEASVINNYSNSISDVVILGRIPAQGNKKIDAETELGSTFTTPLSTGIGLAGAEASNYKIYYSDNANASKDLNDSANGWGETPTTASKSYLIVFNENYEMDSGDKIDFEYDIELPENIEPNNSTYGMYKVYYTNNSEIGSVEETKNSAIIGMTTGAGPELEANLSSTIDTIREGQYVKMKVDVKNIGEVDATGVTVNMEAPEYVTFYDYSSGNSLFEIGKSQSLEIGNIKAGETESIYYYIKIDDDTAKIDPSKKDEMTDEEYTEYLETKRKFPKEIINTVSVTVDGTQGEIKSNECTLEVQDGKIRMSIYANANETDRLKNGDIIDVTIPVFNISTSGDLENIIVSMKLPEGLKYNSGSMSDSIASSEETTEGIEYDQNSNIITINIGKLEIQKYIKLSLEVTTDEEKDFTLMAEAVVNNTETHYSNILEFKTEKIDLEISELTSSPRYVRESENVEYKFSITNNGNSIATQVNVIDDLPEGLTYVEATYKYNDEEIRDTTLKDEKINFIIPRIEPGETIDVTIVAKADLLPDKNDKQVQNKVSISANNFDTVETNTVTNIIEYYEQAHEGENGGETTNNRYRITGTAWLDENMDGRRDTDESTLSGIQVILLNKNGNTIVTDPDSGESKVTTTGTDGSYEFSNLPNGEYLVVFVYDSSNYSLTEYQKAEVDSSYNSDAIDINLTLNGERRIAGITDVLTVNGGNVRDIDIGLYTAEKFDLRLDKYINKITLTTPTIGTRVDEYNDSNIARVEVLERNVGQSSAVIEYKIKVTNEGSVAGYAKKIVDYLPDGITFNSELNADWYLSDNGNIYNASLENEKIEPGETKELTLIVNINITEDLIFSTLSNSAEIYESYNELALPDIDSTVANKVETEDDLSIAEVVVSIVTGSQIIIYALIGLVVIALIGFGTYVIKKHVLNKKV